MAIDLSDPRVGWAQFGKQMELWLDTDIGRYIVSRAEAEIDEATESLKKVDAFDSQAVLKAQNKVKVAETILTWLGDAIREGSSALQDLQGEEFND